MSTEKTNQLFFEIDLTNPQLKETDCCISSAAVDEFSVVYKYKNYTAYCRKPISEQIYNVEIEIEISGTNIIGTVNKFLPSNGNDGIVNDKVPSPPPTQIKFPPRRP